MTTRRLLLFANGCESDEVDGVGGNSQLSSSELVIVDEE